MNSERSMNSCAARLVAKRSSFIVHRSSFVLAFALIATAALALDVPSPPTAFVTDKAGVLDDSQARTLNDKLAQFEQTSGAQFIIYVFPTLDGEVLEDFTIRCGEKWKVG